MYVVVKGFVLEFTGIGGTKNWIVPRESIPDCFGVVAVYKTQMIHVNVMNKVRWEGIKLCEMFG